MRVVCWGDGLAVCLPAVVVEALGLKEGDEIQIRAKSPHQFAASRKPTIAEMLDRIRDLRGSLPADFKFDRDEANAR